MKKILACGFLLAALMPGTAHAQLVERLCDGHIPCSFEQFKAGEIEWFQKADANHDGTVDAQEQAAIWQNYAQDILPDCKDIQNVMILKLKHIPTDEEMHKLFASVDTNNDGVIDAQEDQKATAQVNQTCQLLANPQVQKLQQMFKQFQQK